jgi:hypothetical protein
MSYRNSVHMSIQDTPYHALHGRDMNLPIDMLLLPMTQAGEPPVAQEIQTRMQQIWAEARESNMEAKARMAHYYDRHIVADRVKPGDRVLRKTAPHRGRMSKFVPSFDALFRVIRVEPPNVVIQRMGEDITKRITVHENEVKVFTGVWLEPNPTRATKQQAQQTVGFQKKKAVCAKCYQRGVAGQWIKCDSCGNWYHFACVGLKRAPRVQNWFCPTCREATSSATGPANRPSTSKATPSTPAPPRADGSDSDEVSTDSEA